MSSPEQPTDATSPASTNATQRTPAPALVLVLVRLLPGADRDAYERFTAQIDRPGVLATYASVHSWHLYRLAHTNSLDYDYLEVAAVSDISQFRQDAERPAAADLVRQARQFINEPLVLLANFTV